MLRLSATLLESSRLYFAGVISQESLIESITGKVEETPQMALGTAFHQVFEDPDAYMEMWDDAHVYHSNGFVFDAQLVDKSVADIWAQCPIMEVPSSDLTLQTDYGPVRISCRADAMVGLDVFELKTTQKYPAPERYLNAMQWRAYVLAYGATSVTYRVVQLKHLKEPDVWTKTNYETMTQYPYPQITQDVTYAATRLIEFIQHHNLNEHRQEAA